MSYYHLIIDGFFFFCLLYKIMGHFITEGIQLTLESTGLSCMGPLTLGFSPGQGVGAPNPDTVQGSTVF